MAVFNVMSTNIFIFRQFVSRFVLHYVDGLAGKAGPFNPDLMY